MGRVKCCSCGKPAERLINDNYYCRPCVPKEEITPTMPENTPVCGEDCTCDGTCDNHEVKPKTEGFWDRVAKWFENMGGCGYH